MRCSAAASCLLLLCTGSLHGADTITSNLGHPGPRFEPGMTPATLGWGPLDEPYPDRFVVNAKDGAEMAWVPPGEFTMGSSSEERDWAFRWGRDVAGDPAKREWYDHEGPQHRVRITKGFWFYRHEVTNAQYRRFRPNHSSREYHGLSFDAGNQPVVAVSWNEARDYCTWAGTDLPTEAQWEYSCRAGTQTRFWWGSSEQQAGQYADVADRSLTAELGVGPTFDTDDGRAVSGPVEGYKPNVFGLFDMIGNVWEWCFDWYDRGYYAESPRDDPPGPASGSTRVLRGGSWWTNPPGCRSASRLGLSPETKDQCNLGFRASRSP